MKIKLSSKAKTLEDLKSVITSAVVLQVFRFFAIEYKDKKIEILNSIKSKLRRGVTKKEIRSKKKEISSRQVISNSLAVISKQY